MSLAASLLLAVLYVPAARAADAPQFCDACFSGDYPIRLVDHDKDPAQHQLSLLDERE